MSTETIIESGEDESRESYGIDADSGNELIEAALAILTTVVLNSKWRYCLQPTAKGEGEPGTLDLDMVHEDGSEINLLTGLAVTAQRSVAAERAQEGLQELMADGFEFFTEPGEHGDDLYAVHGDVRHRLVEGRRATASTP